MNTYKHTTKSRQVPIRWASALFVCAILLCIGSVRAQRPEINIGYDRTSQNPCYVAKGWDTSITCNRPYVTLVPVFTVAPSVLNGVYTVDTIPFAPADPSFHSTAGEGGMQIPINVDDGWHTPMPLPFPFHFFGISYDSIQVGGNGLISFKTDYLEDERGCEYQFYDKCPIPNPDFPHKNAIYGVYDDLNPGYSSGLADAEEEHRGIFQSIYGQHPRRKLCVSYNKLFTWGTRIEDSIQPNTYQIVCYEGTNIIEVHVKDRVHGGNLNRRAGLIGIQDSSGTLAYVAKPRNVPDNAYNPFYDATAHLYYNVPAGAAIHNEAFRFSPIGDTLVTFDWYRGSDTLAANRIQSGADDPGNDTLLLVSDTINAGSPNEATIDSKLDVRNLTTTQHITVRMRYTSAATDSAGNNVVYDLSYTFLVGVEKDNDIKLTASNVKLCRGWVDTVRLDFFHDSCENLVFADWHFVNGTFDLNSEQRIREVLQPRGNGDTENTSHYIVLEPETWMIHDTAFFDSIVIFVYATFLNGCSTFDTLRLHYLNSQDNTTDTFTCQGTSLFLFDEELATAGTHYILQDTLGCHYYQIVNLEIKDTHFVPEPITSCRPLAWYGNTYSESTTIPCHTLTDRWGCDSTVNLHFTLDTSLRAIIEASSEQAPSRNSIITFNDVSRNGTDRLWIMPDGSHRTSQMVQYPFPAYQDSLVTTLIAYDPYGCEDTTSLTVTLYRESIWFPNAFTPDQKENARFFVKASDLVSLHVEIYNRNGTLVGRWDGIDGYWDGNDLRGNPCPIGAYMYVARYTTLIEPRIVEMKRGTVTLIR